MKDSNRNFRFYLFSYILSSNGAAASVISINWIIFSSTGNALLIALFDLVNILPLILLSPLAGSVADRYVRKHILVIVFLVNALIMLFIFAYLKYIGLNVLFMLLSLVVLYSVSSFFEPSSTAFLPEIVEEGKIIKANSILMSSAQISGIIGSLLAGVLILNYGGLSGLLYDGILSMFAALFISLVMNPHRKAEAPMGEDSKEKMTFKQAIEYLVKHREIFRLILFFIPINLLSTMVSGFYVVYAYHYFGALPLVYSVLVSIEGVGMAVGSFAPIRLKSIRFEHFLVGEGIIGLTTIGLVLYHSIVLSALLLLIEGIVLGFLTNIYFSDMQINVENRVLGRITGIDSFLGYIAIPLGFVLGGVLSSKFGIEFDFLVSGAGILGTTLLSYFVNLT